MLITAEMAQRRGGEVTVRLAAFSRKSMGGVVLLVALAAQFAADAWSQPAWRPKKAVEVILPAALGGTNDQMVRLMQKILQDQKLVNVPVVPLNKAGGNQTLAMVYLNQHAADPH